MRKQFHSRPGLAMLELTLALPILLFVMALIIDFGLIAARKVDELGVARLAVWEARWPRTGSTDPRPSYFPASANVETSDQGTVAGMDDARVDLPVARGPLSAATVNSELLDPTRGLTEGSATLTAPYPLMGKMGNFTIESQTWLIDDKWQYRQMGMSDNWQRRIPVLYALWQAPVSLMNSYIEAVMAIADAGLQTRLAPLNKDPEFIYYRSLLGLGGPPDFQPEFSSLCSTDRQWTGENVKDLIDQIRGKHTSDDDVPSVAQQMAQSFLGLYEDALARFEAMVKMKNPPAPPAMLALAQSQIPELKAKIKALKSHVR